MQRGLFLLLACFLLAASPDSAVAPDRGSPTVRTEEGVIHACRPSEPELAEAQRELKAIGARIEALAPSDNPKIVFEALKNVLAGPCFRLASHWPGWRDAEPETTAALQTFWETGGEAWFAQFLNLHGEGPVYSRTVPTLRKSLGSDSDPDHPLAALLCPLTEHRCGRETRDWETRAQSALELFSGPHTNGVTGGKQEESSRLRRHECRDLAVEKPRLDRWSAWMDCLQETEDRQAALPFGHMRVPENGWWVIQGRRGHYSFCDEIRAYHLATGTAFVVSSCSRLVLLTDGGVDGRGTDALRKVETRVGQLPLERLREAAWMSFLAPEVQEAVVLSGTGAALPQEITPVRRTDQGMTSGALARRGSSAQTRLSWTWSRSERHRHSGALVWPEDYNRAGYDHAVKLLQMAEADFVESCPHVALPTWLLDPRRLDKTSTQLLDSLRGLVETELCPK